MDWGDTFIGKGSAHTSRAAAPSVVTRWVLALLTAYGALSFVGAPLPARADRSNASSQSAATRSEYTRLIREAVNEFSLRNWSEARAFFERAHRLYPNARTLRGLGFVAYEMQHYLEAEGHLAAALEASEKPLTSAQRAETRALLDRVRTLIGRFTLELAPADARIEVDGQAVDLDGGELKLAVGAHALRATRRGYEDLERELDVRGGEVERLSLQMTPLSAPSPRAIARAEKTAPSGPSMISSSVERQDDDGGLFSSPWFWGAAVAVVAAGVVTAVVVASDGGDSQPATPNSGVTVMLLEAAP